MQNYDNPFPANVLRSHQRRINQTNGHSYSYTIYKCNAVRATRIYCNAKISFFFLLFCVCVRNAFVVIFRVKRFVDLTTFSTISCAFDTLPCSSVRDFGLDERKRKKKSKTTIKCMFEHIRATGSGITIEINN